MKCYKYCIYYLLFFWSLSGLPAEKSEQKNSFLGEEEHVELLGIIDSVIPFEVEKIHNEEVYIVEVKSQKSSDELKALEQSKINDVMYVMEYFQETDKSFFKVFITEPPKKKENKTQGVDKVFFEMSSFQYEIKKNKEILDFLQIDIPYELKNPANFLLKLVVIITFLLIIIPALWFSWRYFKRRKKLRNKKKMERKEGGGILSLLNEAQTRKEFEKIYDFNDRIVRLIDCSEKDLLSLITEINKYQYQEEWGDIEFRLLQEKLLPLQNCRLRRGI